MQPQPIISTSCRNSQLLFSPALFNDTMQLLTDAEYYFRHYGHQDQERLSPLHRLAYNSEMSRITLRLSSIMAWLLARRAAHVSEEVESLHDFSLPHQDVCLEETSPDAEFMFPSYMYHLLDATKALYQRAFRLDNADMPA